MADINPLLEIMRQLRHPETGCPWDQQQDRDSLARYTLEEAYEVLDAIRQGDPTQLCEELGDLLFQVVFHAQVAAEQGDFAMHDVIEAISSKLVTRHPHVFPAHGETLQRDIEGVRAAWEQQKAQERQRKGVQGLLGDIPVALPALQRAGKIQSRLASIGFDWSGAREVLQQLRDEIGELEQAMASGDQAACADELGDVLFSCVNLARHLQLDAEGCLCQCNAKVSRRIAWMEQSMAERDDTLDGQPMEVLEALWQEAKAALAAGTVLEPPAPDV